MALKIGDKYNKTAQDRKAELDAILAEDNNEEQATGSLVGIASKKTLLISNNNTTELTDTQKARLDKIQAMLQQVIKLDLRLNDMQLDLPKVSLTPHLSKKGKEYIQIVDTGIYASIPAFEIDGIQYSFRFSLTAH